MRLRLGHAKRHGMPVSERTELSEHQWRELLGAEAFAVLRERGTEPAGSGEYDLHQPRSGHYACQGCGRPLYSAAAKFQSGCGWPAFERCYAGALTVQADLEHFEAYGCRVEISCSGCDGHLGHVFRGERSTPADERHCVNSLSIRYVAGEPPAPLAETGVAHEYDAAMRGALDRLMGTA